MRDGGTSRLREAARTLFAVHQSLSQAERGLESAMRLLDHESQAIAERSKAFLPLLLSGAIDREAARTYDSARWKAAEIHDIDRSIDFVRHHIVGLRSHVMQAKRDAELADDWVGYAEGVTAG